MSKISQLGLELLEGRDCPSTVNLSLGTLTVMGTDGNDTISLGQTATTITVDGRSYPRASINRIVVSAGYGDDTILDGSGYGSILYGGDGNDIIWGRGGNDRIYGGNGNDKLDGAMGDDIIWGGGGTDVVDGGVGTNVVNEGSPVRVQANTTLEARIIQLVNIERGKVGLPPLAASNALNYAALLHTQDMVILSPVVGGVNALQHTSYGTARPDLTNRLDQAGYDTWTKSFSYGENIAYNYTSAAAVMTAWMNSPGHRANILSTRYSEIGVSVMADASGKLYFTQVFGQQTYWPLPPQDDDSTIG